MLTTVIISRDLNYAKSLFNFLNTRNSNIRIIGIFVEFDELKEIIKNNSVDIIIINIENLDYNFLIENKLLYSYSESTIIISRQYKNIKNKLSVYSYIVDYDNSKEIENIVNKLVNAKLIEKFFECDIVNKNIVMKLIEQELKYLKLRVSYRGVKYLSEAIYILYNLDEFYECNLEKDIYSIIAQKYHKKISNIKSNINYTINMLYAECEEEKLLEYLDEYTLYRISPKKVIFSILNNVKKALEATKV